VLYDLVLDSRTSEEQVYEDLPRAWDRTDQPNGGQASAVVLKHGRHGVATHLEAVNEVLSLRVAGNCNGDIDVSGESRFSARTYCEATYDCPRGACRI
jgi:hypothetical protein